MFHYSTPGVVRIEETGIIAIISIWSRIAVYVYNQLIVAMLVWLALFLINDESRCC